MLPSIQPMLRHPPPVGLCPARPLVMQRYAWSDPEGRWQTSACTWGGVVLAGSLTLRQSHGPALQLEPGGLYLVPAGCPVRMFTSGRELVECRLLADPAALAATWQRIRARGGPDLAGEQARARRSPATAEVEAWAGRLGRGPASAWLAEAFWWAVAAADTEVAPLPRCRRSPPRWLSTAIAGADSGHGLRDGVAGLARLAERSPDHLSRTVRACWGLTAEELVARLRLRHAERLLRDTDLPLAEIARLVGWGSRGWLHARFSAAHDGITPAAWRRQARGGLTPR